MAIGVNGSGDYLRRTVSLPSPTAWSICGWLQQRSLRSSTFHYFAGMDDADTKWMLMGWDGTGGQAIQVTSNAGYADFASKPSLNTWFFWALTCAGTGATDMKGYWGTVGASFVTTQANGASFTPTGLYLGTNGFDEYCDVIIAGVKIWDAALTAAELEFERYTYLPHRYTNLHLVAPLWTTGDLYDLSGNAKALTSGGTLTSENGPPISWDMGQWSTPYAVAAAPASTRTFPVRPVSRPAPVQYLRI